MAHVIGQNGPMITSWRMEMVTIGLLFGLWSWCWRLETLLRMSAIQSILGGWESWSPWIASCLDCPLRGATHQKDGPSSIAQPFWKDPHRHAPKVSLLGDPDRIKLAVETNRQVGLHSLRHVALTQERAHSVKCSGDLKVCQEQALVCLPLTISTFTSKVKPDILSSPVPFLGLA